MRQFKILLRITTLATLLITGLSWKAPDETCHKINAKGKGTTVSMSASGVTTTADLIGGGLLNGTTRADFVFTGLSGEEVFFTGTLVLTTKYGTVTYQVTSGTFNTSTLEFSSDLRVVEGEGRFAGATGTLHLSGANNPDGTFTEAISGVICLSK